MDRIVTINDVEFPPRTARSVVVFYVDGIRMQTMNSILDQDRTHGAATGWAHAETGCRMSRSGGRPAPAPSAERLESNCVGRGKTRSVRASRERHGSAATSAPLAWCNGWQHFSNAPEAGPEPVERWPTTRWKQHSLLQKHRANDSGRRCVAGLGKAVAITRCATGSGTPTQGYGSVALTAPVPRGNGMFTHSQAGAGAGSCLSTIISLC